MYLLQIASDGTVYVRSIKEYHELNRQNINTNQSNNQIIKNETRNVSHQKNTRYSFIYFCLLMFDLLHLIF